jgi:hypothetical protein
MGVGAPEASQHDLAADLFAALFAHEKQVGRIEDPHAAVAHGHARGDVQPLGENAELVRAHVAVCVLENLDAIAPCPGRLARILDALRDPNSAAVVERHGHGINDIRFAGDKVHVKPVRDRHPLEGFQGRIGFVGRFILSVRYYLISRRGDK